MKKFFTILTALVISATAFGQNLDVTADGTVLGTLNPPMGEYEQGAEIPVSATFDANYNGSPISELQIKLMEFTSGWAFVTEYPANHGLDLTSGSINYTYQVSGDVTPTADLPDGNFYLLQVRSLYDDGTTVFANGNITITAGTTTAISNVSEAANLSVSPNPSQSGEIVTINASDFNGVKTVTIYDLGGNEVSSTKTSENYISMQDVALATGMYIVVVSDGEKTGVEKLIVN